jgi:hypothetical protein
LAGLADKGKGDDWEPGRDEAVSDGADEGDGLAAADTQIGSLKK